MTPENNLAVQTEVIRGAEAFVGTYGGFSYLAPLCGVEHAGVLLARERVPLRPSRGGQARVLGAALRHVHRGGSARDRASCGSGSRGADARSIGVDR